MTEQDLTDFILSNENADPAELILHRDRWPDIDMTIAARCIQGRSKARTKLPLWYAEPGLVYPQSLSLEQCSSQATALYKQRFTAPSYRVADFTGGLGVDTWSLSMASGSVDYYERSEELCRCARHNFSILGMDNIHVRNAETGPEMLQTIPSDSYSLIYIDPARRDKDGGRVYSLKDCEPDVTVLLQELLRIAPRILLKASPMADIGVLLSELPQSSEIHIVSLAHECKEVLVLIGRDNAIPAEEIPVTAVELKSAGNALEQTAEFRFTLEEERNAAAETALPDQIRGYLFEPSPAILKAGAFKLPAVRFGLRKISASTHCYIGESPVPGFPGKVRRIIETIPFNKAAIRDFRKTYPSCSVTARNFPLTSEQLKVRLGTSENSSLHVLGTTASDRSRILVVTEALL